jgi:hypothetical protein
VTLYATGFLMIARGALEAIGPDPVAVAVYLELNRRARWEAPVKRNTARGVVELDIGQCFLGRDELAEAVGASIRECRTALARLSKCALIAQQTTNRGTVVTLLGFKESRGPQDGERPARDQQATSSRPASDQQVPTTKKEDSDPDLVFSGSADPLREPPGDLGSARLGPRLAPAGSHVDPGAIEEYERLRREGGWGAPMRPTSAKPPLPGLRLLTGGDS